MNLTKSEIMLILAGLKNLDEFEKAAVDQAMACVRDMPESKVTAQPFAKELKKRIARERVEFAKEHGLQIGEGLLEKTCYVVDKDGGEWYVPLRIVMEVYGDGD